MAIVLLLMLGALVYAGYESIRARFFAGIGALLTLLYLTVARLASEVPLPNMPLRDGLASTWWLYPALALCLAVGPTFFARRIARELPAPRNTAIGRAGVAFGVALVFDIALLVWGGAAAVLGS